MTKEKTPGSAKGTKGSKSKHRNYTPREQRVIEALRKVPVSREEVDAIAGASNGPAVISNLRHKCGCKIWTQMVSKIDQDGLQTKYGVYHLIREASND